MTYDGGVAELVTAYLRAAVSEASFATTQAQLAKASGDLAEAMKAVGLDRWPRFVADAQARARDPATVAAIEMSLQPPDLKRDAITPVYPVEKALAVGAAAVTGGAAGAVGGAIPRTRQLIRRPRAFSTNSIVIRSVLIKERIQMKQSGSGDRLASAVRL